MACSNNTEKAGISTTFDCCTCKEKNIEAEKYCVECQDYYCKPCVDIHGRFPSTRGHKLVDKADFQNELVTPNYPVDRCPFHKEKLLDIWCKKHDEIVCATCATLRHSLCSNVHCISEDIDKLYEKSTADSIKQQLATALTTVKDIKKSKDTLLALLNKSKNNAIDAIRKFRKEIEAELEKLEKESIKEVAAEYDKIAPRLNKDIKEAEAHIDELQQSCGKLQQTGGNKTQEFIYIKVAAKSVLNANVRIKHLEQHLDVKISFLPDVDAKNFMKQLQKFGNVPQLGPNVTTQKEVNVKLSNDTDTCNIHGSCFTKDGSLLLTDTSNKKLKRVNLSTGSIDDLTLKEMPFGVCQTSKNEAAVALYSQNIIQFVSLGSKMEATKQIKLGHYCYGLAYKANKLFISGNPNTFYSYGITGAMLRKITSDNLGKQIFSYNRHVCLSSNGDKLHIANSNAGMITLDIEGNYESTFTDPELSYAQGVCTDDRGNIFVCDCSYGNIIQINENSKQKVRVLRKVFNGTSVCFDPQQNKLVVTVDSRNTVLIFDLQY